MKANITRTLSTLLIGILLASSAFSNNFPIAPAETDALRSVRAGASIFRTGFRAQLLSAADMEHDGDSFGQEICSNADSRAISNPFAESEIFRTKTAGPARNNAFVGAGVGLSVSLLWVGVERLDDAFGGLPGTMLKRSMGGKRFIGMSHVTAGPTLLDSPCGALLFGTAVGTGLGLLFDALGHENFTILRRVTFNAPQTWPGLHWTTETRIQRSLLSVRIPL